jgi:signal transduction histidine kinase
MTIQRRLVLSNILMIVLPLLLSVGAALLIFFGVFSLSIGRLRKSNEIKGGEKEARALMRSWREDTPVSQMLRDIGNYNARYEDGGLRLTLYRAGKPVSAAAVFPPEIAGALNTHGFSVLRREGKYQFVVTDTETEAKKTIGEYQAVLTETDSKTYAPRLGLTGIYFAAAAGLFIFIAFVAAIVFLANRFLIRFVFDVVMRSIETLRYGVGQIRDGNLSYRLDTAENNEFDPVCADFNEMAARLLDSVETRLRDEAARKELIAGISHDLRTPLTSVRAYVEGIEHELDSTPEIRGRYIQIIKNKLRDLEQITGTLFLFSSLDLDEFPWRMENTELAGELGSLVSGLKDEYEARGLAIFLSAESEKKLWVRIDPRQTRNALINILENSVKYKTKERGKMEIALSRNNGSAIIAMTDDGPGVPEESLGRLFDLFYRVDSSRGEAVKGNGLGLAIAAKVIHSFGGTIHAKNHPAGGLSIIVELPLTDDIGSAEGETNFDH